ncbi:MAG: ATPase [Pelagerythrobacter marensis]|nr:MAG: ATPase [Pelagerythrobacter marensis]
MSGGWNVRAVGQEGAHHDAHVDVYDDAQAGEIYADDAGQDPDDAASARMTEQPEARRPSRAPLVLAMTLASAWTIIFVWGHLAKMRAGAPLAQWTGWLADWALPLILLGVIWLLSQRNSAREAYRFGLVSTNLAHQSAELEERMSVVNRELSLAREFLAAQSRELESLGRVAGDRLSSHADRLQGLIADNGAQVDAIATVSTRALENMERLRDDLPVVANSSRDVANLIAHAGTTAQSQIDELVSGFARLNEFGGASERQVATVRERVNEALESMERHSEDIAKISEQRLVALREQSEAHRAELGSREVEVLAAMHQRAERLRDNVTGIEAALSEAQDRAASGWDAQLVRLREDLLAAIDEVSQRDQAASASASARLAALRDEAEAVDANLAERDRLFFVQMDERRSAAERQSQVVIDGLSTSMAELDAIIAERREDQIAQTRMLTEHGEAIAARLQDLSSVMEGLSDHGRRTEAGLASAAQTLTAYLNESTVALTGTDAAVRDLTEASVRLLELIDATHRQTREDLPRALDTVQTRFATVERAGEVFAANLTNAARESERLKDQLATARGEAAGMAADLETLQQHTLMTAEAHRTQIDAMHQSLVEAGRDNDELAMRAQQTLSGALAGLTAATRDALASLESRNAARVQSLAAQIGDATAEAIERAIRERTAGALAELEQGATQATGVARDATIQLRDQLARVNELAGNLENRIARAQERAEEQINHDFARRMALITDSLNSNAIDIANALAVDVSDTAWSAYLRGDRGIFTRRAVRLIDNGEAREIAQLYEADAAFRDHVRRYIHDFEAMLRAMLSTRDGHALGVTLLSSDMGKLYVVLAQAIERLRD